MAAPFDWAITHDALLHPKIYLTSMIALGCWCMKDLMLRFIWKIYRI